MPVFFLEIKGGEKEGMNTSNDNLNEETIKVASKLYEIAGRVEGRDLENWLEAERIVKEGEQFNLMFKQMLTHDPASAIKLMEAIKPLIEIRLNQ